MSLGYRTATEYTVNLKINIMFISQFYREPDILHTIEAELQKFGLLDVNGEGRELTYDVINKLEYVHCFIQEVLRVFPPVGAVFRKAEKTLSIAVSDCAENQQSMLCVLCVCKYD